jgi:hypothetical protein
MEPTIHGHESSQRLVPFRTLTSGDEDEPAARIELRTTSSLPPSVPVSALRMVRMMMIAEIATAVLMLAALAVSVQVYTDAILPAGVP